MILYILLLVTIDQLSKYLFYDVGYYQGSISLFQPVLNIGISRSISADIFIVMVTTILFMAVLIWFHNVAQIDRRVFILLLSGTIGNFIDRLIYSGVRDWLWLLYGPVFNIADILITLGLVIYIYKSIIKKD